MSQSGLVLRTTVVQLVAEYQLAVSEVREGFATIQRAENRLRAAFTLGGDVGVRIDVKHGCHHPPDWSAVDATIEAVKRQAWVAIVERLELRRMMSIAAWEALEKNLDSGPLPEITVEAVSTFAQGYLDSLWDMHREAVREVFDWLRPRSAHGAGAYKTNSKTEIGPKVVLTRMVDADLGRWRLQWEENQRILALENVFSALDGKGLVAKTYWSELRSVIDTTNRSEGETTWFRYKLFRNGNLHLSFKRLDLLEQINAIAGGKNLRPTGSGKAKPGSIARAA